MAARTYFDPGVQRFPADVMTRERRIARRMVVAIVILMLVGCVGRGARAPIVDMEPRVTTTKKTTGASASAGRSSVTRRAVPPVHVVVKGDTLHAIAWRYGLDHRNLVRWNRIKNPNLIVIGQRLRLHQPKVVKTAPTPPKSTAVEQSRQAKRPTPKAVKQVKPEWHWPAAGKVKKSVAISGSTGLNIIGQRNDPVKAAAAGTVVYSGSGLRGYGELIIIQHNETFLSAYAHNEARLVREGQRVASGDVIARMGSSGTKHVVLHFEIRRNGKAVDPLAYLPKRS